MTKLHYYFTFMFCIFMQIQLQAQEVQVAKNGDYIIVMPDGTYENYDSEVDWHKKMVKEYNQKKKKEKKASKHPDVTKTTTKTVDKKEVNQLYKTLNVERLKGQVADKALSNRLDIEYQLDKIKKIAVKKNNQDIKNIEKKLASAKKEEKEATKNFKKSNASAKKARKQLSKLNVDYSLYPPYKLATADEMKALADANRPQVNNEQIKIEAIQDIEITEKIEEEKEETLETPKEDKDKSKKKKEKKPAKIAEKKSKKEKTPKVTESKTAATPIADKIDKIDKIDKKTTQKAKKLSPQDDVMITPPPSACAIAFEGIDEFSGKLRREVASTTLFQFTESSMKKYYEGEDFLVCEANVSAVGNSGYKYVNFMFKFASNNLGTSYGWLEKDNIISVRFVDGTTLNLFNTRTDRGQVDDVNRSTTYKAICAIGSGEEKILAKGEIDAIRVTWSAGTEDYEVYDIDFFADQLRCLNQKNNK